MGIFDLLFGKKPTSKLKEKNRKTNSKILPLIETFEKPKPAPKLDPSSDNFFEDAMNLAENYDTYEINLQSGKKLPPSLTDTLSCDICTLNERDDDDFQTSHITIQNIKYAFNKYLKSSLDEIAGYRPRVHSNFIKQFQADELALLAKEILQYIDLNGVRKGDD